MLLCICGQFVDKTIYRQRHTEPSSNTSASDYTLHRTQPPAVNLMRITLCLERDSKTRSRTQENIWKGHIQYTLCIQPIEHTATAKLTMTSINRASNS